MSQESPTKERTFAIALSIKTVLHTGLIGQTKREDAGNAHTKVVEPNLDAIVRAAQTMDMAILPTFA